MMTNCLKALRNMLFSGLFATALGVAVNANAQMPPGMAPDMSAGANDYGDYSDTGEMYTEADWENDKVEIQKVLEEERARLYKMIDDNLTPKRVVDMVIKPSIKRHLNQDGVGDFRILRIPGITVNWDDYDKAPTMSKEAIVDSVRADAEATATREVRPDERKALVDDEAEERYKMYQKGERVSIILRGGRGANAIIEDLPFTAISEEVVQLGRRLIIRSDLDELDVAKFYEDVNKTAKEAYIRNERGKIDVEYESMVDSLIIKNTPPKLLECGYVPDIKKSTASLRTAKIDFWIGKKEFVQRLRSDLIKLARERVEQVELPAFMRGKGYILAPTLTGNDEEWINEQEKARREALKNNNGMGPGMYDPMMGPPPGMM